MTILFSIKASISLLGGCVAASLTAFSSTNISCESSFSGNLFNTLTLPFSKHMACSTLPFSVFIPNVKLRGPSSHLRYFFNYGRVLKLKAKNLKNRLASVFVKLFWASCTCFISKL
jgi:hypothetical protein